MRTKPNVRKDVNDGDAFYEFTTRSASNGKPEFIEIDRDGDPTTAGRPYVTSVRKAKPYLAASASGELVVGEGSSIISDFTCSEILYRALADNPHLLSTVNSKYSDAEAVNYAILAGTEYGDVLALVSLAESKETISMVRNIFRTLYNLIFGIYKKVKNLKPWEAYEVASDIWLEYRYGWRPLAGEIEALYDLMKSSKLYSVQSAYGLDRYADINHVFKIEDLEFYHYDMSFKGDVDITIKDLTIKAGFNYFNQPEDPNVSLIAQLGLDVESFLATGFDLIPFSFILNMFGNFSQYITIMERNIHLKPFNGYITRQYHVDVNTEYTVPQLYSAFNYLKSYYDEEKAERKYLDSLRGEGSTELGIDPYDIEYSRYICILDPNKVPESDALVVTWYDKIDRSPVHIDKLLARHEVSHTWWQTLPSGLHTLGWNYDRYIEYDLDGRFVRRDLQDWGPAYDKPRELVHTPPPRALLKHYGVEASLADIIQAEKAELIPWINYVDWAREHRKSTGETQLYLKENWFSWLAAKGLPGWCGQPKFKIGDSTIPSWFGTIDQFDGWRTSSYQSAIQRQADKLMVYRMYPNRSERPLGDLTFLKSFEGVVTQRYLKKDFDFNFLANADLSKSQMADLAIFAERLISAWKKS